MRIGWSIILFLFISFALWPTQPAYAATLTVNTTADNLTAGDGGCTLREAIINANDDSDTTGGDCAAGSGADTITFNIGAGGAQTITLNSFFLPDITTPIFVDGSTQPGYAGTPLIHINTIGTALRVNNASSVHVNGLDLSLVPTAGTRQGMGLRVENGSLITVTNTTAGNREFGLYLNNSSDLWVQNNDLPNNTYALHARLVSPSVLPGSVLVFGNSYHYSRTGVRLVDATDLRISDGTLPNSNVVFLPTEGLNTTGQPIWLDNATSAHIDTLDLSYDSGLGTRQGTGLRVESGLLITVTNTTAGNRSNGLHFYNSSDLWVQNNNLPNNTYALNVRLVPSWVLPGGVLFVSGNSYHYSTTGIRLLNATDLRISDGTLPNSNLVLLPTEGLTTTVQPILLDNVISAHLDTIDLSYDSGLGTRRGWGLDVRNSALITVANITAGNRQFGLHLNNSSDLWVQNNNLPNNTYALYARLDPSSVLPGGVLVYGNSYHDSSTGIRLVDATDLRISDGTLPKSNVVLLPTEGLNTTVQPLLLEKVTSAHLDTLDLSYDSGLGTRQGRGLRMEDGSLITVTNTTAGNRQFGLYLNSSSDLWVQNNNLPNNTYALYARLDPSSVLPGGVLVSGNSYHDSSTGVRLLDATDLRISDGTLPDSNVVLLPTEGLTTTTGQPIWLDNATSVHLDTLDFSYDSALGTRQGTGLRVENGSLITVTNTTVGNRGDGLRLYNVQTADLSCLSLLENTYGLTASSAGSNGIVLWDSRIQGNNAGINNTTATIIMAESNYWGASDGPSNLGGSGDSYNSPVDAAPFLSISPACANVAPVAVNDTYTGTQNTPLMITDTGVLANDSDPDMDLLSVVTYTQPATGTLDLAVNGAFTYTPPANWVGVTKFSYVVGDGVVTDTATVTLTVFLADGVVPTVTISALDANDTQLTWSSNSINCGYQVHSAGAAYFTADNGNAISDELPDNTGSYLLSGAISGGSNIFYKVMGVGCSGVDAPSNEVGIFHFAIMPGD